MTDRPEAIEYKGSQRGSYPMQLKDLPDWFHLNSSLAGLAVLKRATPSQLRHFAIVEFEYQGGEEFRLLEVGPELLDRVVDLLNRNAGLTLDEIGSLDLGP
ncbi:MAG TPA: hypothetical protein VNL14_19640 [Candidatus Acidoferrales bacterium]|nr:hypothetical protein [Candidatus Acidoferrales bacterium]